MLTPQQQQIAAASAAQQISNFVSRRWNVPNTPADVRNKIDSLTPSLVAKEFMLEGKTKSWESIGDLDFLTDVASKI